MLKVKQVAARFAVSQHTVLLWIDNGELSAVDVSRNPGGKPQWRITPEAVDAFELSRMPTPPAPAPRKRRRKADPSFVQYY